MATRSMRACSGGTDVRSQVKRAAALAAAALLAAGTRHTARAEIVSGWSGGNGDWTSPGLWSDNDPFFSGYPNNGNGGQTFSAVINSGTVNLNAPISINALNFGGGIITGANTLTLGQQSDWTAGKLGGGGTFVANAGMNFSGTSLKRLRANLTLGGNSVWSAGDIELSLVFTGDDEIGHSVLTNNGTFRIDTDNDMFGATAAEATVINNGVMIKEVGAGTTEIDAPFMNSGTLTVNTGTVQLNFGGTQSGHFTGAGTVRFSRGHTFNPGASVSAANAVFDLGGVSNVNTPDFSPATLNVNSAAVRFNRSPALSNVILNGGSIGGTASVNISGTLTWSLGDMTDAGKTLLAGGGNAATFSGGTKRLLSGRQLQNNTVAKWTGGNFSNDSDTIFDNPGTLNIETDASFTGGTFKNSGLVVKSGGAGTTSFNAAFHNAGTVRTDSGTLSFNGDGDHTGVFSNGAASGTILRFGGGDNTIMPGGTIDHPHIVLAGGFFNLNGNWVSSPAQQVDVSGAIFNFNGVGKLSPGTLNVSAGTVTLSNGGNHQPGTLNFSGGNIQGGDNLNVGTVLNWSGGAIFGSGQVTAPALGITGNAPKMLGGTRQFINNSSSATWDGDGNIQAGDNSVFTNPITARLNLLSDADYLGGTFNNAGQVNKSGGTGTSSLTGAFNNSGTVNVLSGTLSLDGTGNQTGTFNGTAGASSTLGLGGNITFAANSHILGPNILVTAGTTDVAGQYALPSSRITTLTGGTLRLHNGPLPQFGLVLNIAGGTLDLQSPVGVQANYTGTRLNLSSGVYQGTGSGNFGVLNFTGGVLQGSGTVRALILAISSDTAKQIAGNRELINIGETSYWDGAGDINNASTAAFTNDNTFEIRNAATFNGGTFNNNSVLSKSSAGTTTITGTFENSGSVTIGAGELKLQGDSTQSGTLDGVGRLRFAGGNHTLTPTSIITPQDLVIESATVQSQGQWGPRNTTVNSGALVLSGAQAYPSGSSLAVNGGTVDVNSDAGSPTSSPLAVSVANATVNFNTTQHLGSLSAAAGAHVNVAAAAAAAGKPASPNILVTRSLAIAPLDAFVDLHDDALIVDYDAKGPSPLNDVRARIFSAYEATATDHWRGPGIASSTAAAAADRALGYAEASDVLGPGGGNFMGESIDATAVLVRCTLVGDANLDGSVNFADLVALAQSYNTSSGAAWSHGDFNFDGAVNFSDLVGLAQNYNAALPSAAAAATLPAVFMNDFQEALSQVPEPSLWPLTFLAPAIRPRRRRHVH
ncbi:MAG TPA: dockerin type I domain-containing protein [Tepidisphaeraceae bacterium]